MISQCLVYVMTVGSVDAKGVGDHLHVLILGIDSMLPFTGIALLSELS